MLTMIQLTAQTSLTLCPLSMNFPSILKVNYWFPRWHYVRLMHFLSLPWQSRIKASGVCLNTPLRHALRQPSGRPIKYLWVEDPIQWTVNGNTAGQACETIEGKLPSESFPVKFRESINEPALDKGRRRLPWKIENSPRQTQKSRIMGQDWKPTT